MALIDPFQQLVDRVKEGAAKPAKAKAGARPNTGASTSARGRTNKAGAGKYLDVKASPGTGWSYINPQGIRATNVNAPHTYNRVHTNLGGRARYGDLQRTGMDAGMGWSGLSEDAKRSLIVPRMGTDRGYTGGGTSAGGGGDSGSGTMKIPMPSIGFDTHKDYGKGWTLPGVNLGMSSMEVSKPTAPRADFGSRPVSAGGYSGHVPTFDGSWGTAGTVGKALGVDSLAKVLWQASPYGAAGNPIPGQDRADMGDAVSAAMWALPFLRAGKAAPAAAELGTGKIPLQLGRGPRPMPQSSANAPGPYNMPPAAAMKPAGVAGQMNPSPASSRWVQDYVRHVMGTGQTNNQQEAIEMAWKALGY